MIGSLKNFSYFLVVLQTFVLFSFGPVRTFAEPKGTPYYDEVFDEEGNVRPQYKAVYEALSNLSDAAYRNFFKQASKLTKKDIPLSPTPRILTESEYEVVKKGVEQRSRAIQAFLKDHYGGTQTYRDKVIPGPIIDEILKRSGDDQFVGKIPKDHPFRFVYGPDLIRDKSGNWLVLEDNVGFVGGPGDLVATRDLWQKLAPQVASAVPAQNNPRDHVIDIYEKMKSLSKPEFGFRSNEGAIVYLAYPPYSDLEDPRLMEQLEKMGVTLVTKNTAKKRAGSASKEIVVREDGVYLKETSKYGAELPEKKVGFVWMSGEHTFYDGKDPLTYKRSLREEAASQLEDVEAQIKKGKSTQKLLETRRLLENALKPDSESGSLNISSLEEALRFSFKNFQWLRPSVLTDRSIVPGLTDAILSGKVQANYSPGIDFVGDKMFHTFMEDLVRHYLNEEPILKNPETRRFFKVAKDGSIVIDEKTFKDALENKDGRVAKIVDGRGGQGINLGNRRTKKQWTEILKDIRDAITKSVSQDYHHPPVVNDGRQERIVDLRPLSFVDETGTLVSRSFFGRSTLKAGTGLMNMSAGDGVEMNVTIVPDPKCAAGFKKAAARKSVRTARNP